MKNLILLLLICVQALARPDLILPPSSSKGADDVALVLIQGAQIPNDRYAPLAKEIQRQASFPLWVVLPEATLDLPLGINKAFTRSMTLLKGNNFTGTKIFAAGHSLGAARLQIWTSNNAERIAGQILMGSALERIVRGSDYPAPTVTIAAELDGLYRISRVAEEVYLRKDMEKFPVVVVPGMSHLQFASGQPPALVKAKDLKPEIDFDTAHQRTAMVIVEFMAETLSSRPSSALAGMVAATRQLVAPIIAAYEYEGARYFNAPNQKGGPKEDCPKGLCKGPGSASAIQAQLYIGEKGLLAKEGLTLSVDNKFAQLSSTPISGGEFHLPQVEVKGKTISITTYSQAKWDDEIVDAGFVPTSAIEIGTKLVSRQCILIRGANHSKNDTPFSVDDGDFCADHNSRIYQWALDHAEPKTRQRFEEFGQKYTFGPDVAAKTGFTFLGKTLVFASKVADDGKQVIEISAPMIKTSIDLPHIPGIPDLACYHYCKLLSPARAMEWIYLDGLRLNMGLKSGSKDA